MRLKLEKLRVKKGSSWWEAFVKAVKTFVKKEDIEKYKQRIMHLQMGLQGYLSLRIEQNGVEIQAMLKESQRLAKDTAREVQSLGVDIKKTLEDLRDASMTKGDVVEKIAHLKKLVQRKDKISAEQRIMESLYSEELEGRFEAVREAHAQTFDWILKDIIPSDDEDEEGLRLYYRD